MEKDIKVRKEFYRLCDAVDRVKVLEKENAELKETIKNLRWEGEEYQKKLDQIDELALLIENAIKRIRGKI